MSLLSITLEQVRVFAALGLLSALLLLIAFIMWLTRGWTDVNGEECSLSEQDVWAFFVAVAALVYLIQDVL